MARPHTLFLYTRRYQSRPPRRNMVHEFADRSRSKQPKLKRSTLGYQETNETFTQQDLSQLELQLPNLYFRTND